MKESMEIRVKAVGVVFNEHLDVVRKVLKGHFGFMEIDDDCTAIIALNSDDDDDNGYIPVTGKIEV